MMFLMPWHHLFWNIMGNTLQYQQQKHSQVAAKT